MRRMSVTGLFILLISAWIIAGGCAKKEDAEKIQVQAQEIETVSFSQHIMPVFTRSCAVCHKREGGNPHAVDEGTFFEQKEDVLSKIGTYILPGKPEESGLLHVLDQTLPVGEKKIVMPPPGTNIPKWSEDELALFSKWISQGAEDN